MNNPATTVLFKFLIFIYLGLAILFGLIVFRCKVPKKLTVFYALRGLTMAFCAGLPILLSIGRYRENRERACQVHHPSRLPSWLPPSKVRRYRAGISEVGHPDNYGHWAGKYFSARP